MRFSSTRTLLCALWTLAFLTGASTAGSQQNILVIQDETPQLKPLIGFLEREGGHRFSMVESSELPESLKAYDAVMMFIHGRLDEAVEKAVIDYTRGGGRFICLHHSISSGKARNRHYFDFLGIQLDEPQNSAKPVRPGGGYGWYHAGEKGVPITIVNLNPGHFITSHGIEWPEKTDYESSDGPSVRRSYPSVTLEATEAYMNHKFTDGRAKTVLCGIKYRDERNGEMFMQDRAVWIKPQGEGEVIYFLPGDRPTDYEEPVIAQMILNALEWER